MELAAKLVIKWKKVIKNGDRKALRKDEKKVNADPLPQLKSTKSATVPQKCLSVSSNLKESKEATNAEIKSDSSVSNVEKKFDSSVVIKKDRPKIAKAKISKPRSTGNNFF